MLLEFVRNIKQFALTHAVSAAVVVQGVAVQQATIQDFSERDSEIMAVMEAEKNQNRISNFDDEAYWQDISESSEAS